MISSVDENFVEYLEESGDIFNLPVYHPLMFRVIRPHNLTCEFDTPYVHVRTLQDMLKL